MIQISVFTSEPFIQYLTVITLKECANTERSNLHEQFWGFNERTEALCNPELMTLTSKRARATLHHPTKPHKEMCVTGWRCSKSPAVFS